MKPVARTMAAGIAFLAIAAVCSVPRFGHRENELLPSVSDSDFFIDMARVFTGEAAAFNPRWVALAPHHYNRPLLSYLAGISAQHFFTATYAPPSVSYRCVPRRSWRSYFSSSFADTSRIGSIRGCRPCCSFPAFLSSIGATTSFLMVSGSQRHSRRRGMPRPSLNDRPTEARPCPGPSTSGDCGSAPRWHSLRAKRAGLPSSPARISFHGGEQTLRASCIDVHWCSWFCSWGRLRTRCTAITSISLACHWGSRSQHFSIHTTSWICSSKPPSASTWHGYLLP